MGRGLVIGAILVGATTAAIAGHSLYKKKDAADKLQLGFQKLRIKKATLADGLQFDVVLSAVNPTTTPLTFTQPFVSIFLEDDKGGSSLIGNSTEAKGTITLDGRTSQNPNPTKTITVPLQVTAMQALKLPGLVTYLIKQFLNPNNPKNKKVRVEYSTTAMGIDIDGSTEVNI